RQRAPDFASATSSACQRGLKPRGKKRCLPSTANRRAWPVFGWHSWTIRSYPLREPSSNHDHVVHLVGARKRGHSWPSVLAQPLVLLFKIRRGSGTFDAIPHRTNMRMSKHRPALKTRCFSASFYRAFTPPHHRLCRALLVSRIVSS